MGSYVSPSMLVWVTTLAEDLPFLLSMNGDLVYRVCYGYGSSHRLEPPPPRHLQPNHIRCLLDLHR